MQICWKFYIFKAIFQGRTFDNSCKSFLVFRLSSHIQLFFSLCTLMGKRTAFGAFLETSLFSVNFFQLPSYHEILFCCLEWRNTVDCLLSLRSYYLYSLFNYCIMPLQMSKHLFSFQHVSLKNRNALCILLCQKIYQLFHLSYYRFR